MTGKQAQIENALYHLVLGDNIITEQVQLGIKGITSRKAGGVAESYSRGQTTKHAINGIYTDKVFSILRPWISDSRFSI